MTQIIERPLRVVKSKAHQVIEAISSTSVSEFIDKEAYKHKNAVGYLRGAAYALFKYVETLDDKLDIEKPMTEVEIDNVLYRINDLFKELSDSYEFLKKSL